MSPSTSSASITASRRPYSIESSTTTDSPASRNARTVCEPMYPAPPVTSTLITSPSDRGEPASLPAGISSAAGQPGGDVAEPFEAEPLTDLGVGEEAVGGVHAIAPPDLLALGVGTPVVADADFVDPAVQAGDLGGQLRLDAEAGLFDLDPLQHVAPEGLVPRLHVGEVEVGAGVRQQCQQT